MRKLLLSSDHTNPRIQVEVRDRRKFIMALRRKILTLKKLELTFEIVPQVTIFCLMILLKNSDTNLETGLEAVFEVEPTFGMTIELFLILNILWSIKTGIITALKVKKESKGFIPSKGSLLSVLIISNMSISLLTF